MARYAYATRSRRSFSLREIVAKRSIARNAAARKRECFYTGRMQGEEKQTPNFYAIPLLPEARSKAFGMVSVNIYHKKEKVFSEKPKLSFDITIIWNGI